MPVKALSMVCMPRTLSYRRRSGHAFFRRIHDAVLLPQ